MQIPALISALVLAVQVTPIAWSGGIPRQPLPSPSASIDIPGRPTRAQTAEQLRQLLEAKRNDRYMMGAVRIKAVRPNPQVPSGFLVDLDVTHSPAVAVSGTLTVEARAGSGAWQRVDQIPNVSSRIEISVSAPVTANHTEIRVSIAVEGDINLDNNSRVVPIARPDLAVDSNGIEQVVGAPANRNRVLLLRITNQGLGPLPANHGCKYKVELLQGGRRTSESEQALPAQEIPRGARFERRVQYGTSTADQVRVSVTNCPTDLSAQNNTRTFQENSFRQQ